MLERTKIEKRSQEERIKTSNCYDCGVKLLMNEIKKNPESEGDDRNFCKVHFKLRFGKKRQLIKRY